MSPVKQNFNLQLLFISSKILGISETFIFCSQFDTMASQNGAKPACAIINRMILQRFVKYCYSLVYFQNSEGGLLGYQMADITEGGKKGLHCSSRSRNRSTTLHFTTGQSMC